MDCASCMGRKKARVMIDHTARRTSCSVCGHEFEDGVDVAENKTVRVADPINPEPKNDSLADSLSRFLENSQTSDSVSVANSQPQSGSSDDFLSLTLGNSHTRRDSDPLSIATTETSTASPDDFLPSNIGNFQNRSFDPLSIATSQPQNSSYNNFLSTLANSHGSDPPCITFSHQDFKPFDLGSLQNQSFDPLSIATSQPQNSSYNNLLTTLANSQTLHGSDPPSITFSHQDFKPFDLGSLQNRSFDPLSITTSQRQNSSYNNFLSTLANSQTPHGSDPLSIATTKTNIVSYEDFKPFDLGSLLNRSRLKQTKATILATISHRLRLPATVENRANGFFKSIEHSSMGHERTALSAACIYIVCRSFDEQTRSLAEIHSAAYGATMPDIIQAIEFLAGKMKVSKDQLLTIKAVDLIKRFCCNLGMDSEAVKAAEEVAKNYDVIETSQKGPESVAAAVLYVIGQLSYEKKQLNDVIQATGVSESMIKGAYKDLYPYLVAIIPMWVANGNDFEKPW